MNGQRMDNHQGIRVVLFLAAIVFSIVSSGRAAEQYQYVRMWPQLSNPWYFNGPQATASDGSGNIYVANADDVIKKFSVDGELVDEWGSEGSGNGQFDFPQGIGVDRRGFVYVADTWNNRIQKFTPDGEYVAKWGNSGYAVGEFDNPTDVAVDGNGLVYVVDQGNDRVQVFSRVPGGDLYFPHCDTTSFWETEIAVINASPSSTLQGTLLAFDRGGDLLPESLDISLTPHQRLELSIGSEFADPDSISYLILESDSTMAEGYTKFYQPGLYRVAVPAVSEAAGGDMPVTHIASDAFWWTGLALVNTTASEAMCVTECNTGDSHTLSLAPFEHQSFSIDGFYGGVPQPGLQSAMIRDASGIIGLELFGSPSELEGIPLSDRTATTLYYPHIASDSTWWTGIVAYNPSDTDCGLLIMPYTATGTVLPGQTQLVPGRGKYVGTTDGLSFPAEAAWFIVTSTAPVSGFELFGTRNQSQMAGFSSIGEPSEHGVFAEVEPNGWTGIALVNTEALSASVTLTAYDDEGAIVGGMEFSLAGHDKAVDVAEDFFPSQDISSATYISYSSNRELIGFQLNGSADGTMLDGLPGM